MPAPRGILQQFDAYLHASGLLAPGARVLVACSGGADSVALVRLLHAANRSRHWNWTLVVGHVNHGLRGRASEADARAVKQLAGTLGLRYVSAKLRLQPGRSGRVSEAAARAARLKSLRQLARRSRCTVVALAHHADDQAETLLLRLLRGTGVLGLGAMAERTQLGMTFVRPLLGFTRQELRQYLVHLGESWREDHTNQTLDFLRNRVRHELLPLLEKLQPQVRAALVRLAAQARQWEAALAEWADELATRSVQRLTARQVVLKRAELRAAPAILVAEMLRRALERHAVPVSAERLDAAVQAARGRKGGQTIELGGGAVWRVAGKEVLLRLRPKR